MSSNFNSTVPAAPAGGTNVIFQTDGAGNDSAYVPGFAPVDLTAQVANISATNLLTSLAASARFRISVYAVVTVVDGASSTLPSVTISWTDADNVTVQSVTVTPTNSGNLLTTLQSADLVISAAITTNVTYATAGYASGTPATMNYALHIVTEKL